MKATMERANLEPLTKRVEESLKRLGYPDIIVTNLGDGKIKLSGRVESTGDRAVAIAAAKAVSGVIKVTSKVRP